MTRKPWLRSKQLALAALLIGTALWAFMRVGNPRDSASEIGRKVPARATAVGGTSFDARSGLARFVVDRATGIRLVLIPGGSVRAERSQFREAQDVRVVHDLYIGVYEVTQSQWTATMGVNPSQFKLGGDYPVESVTYEEIGEFLARTGFRLPTGEEWEYACRAGTTGPSYGPLDQVAWHEWNSGESIAVPGDEEPRRVGRKLPNQFGTHDMLGNVMEICTGRKTKGGHYYTTIEFCDPSFTGEIESGYRDEGYGFRVARNP